MGIFDTKSYVTRPKLRQALAKMSGAIPGSSKRFGRLERKGLEKEIFGRKYGNMIDKREFKRKLLELRRQKFRGKTREDKLEISHKMRILEKLRDI